MQCTCVASSVPGVLINNDQSRTGAFNRTRPHMAWSFHTTPHRPRTTSAAQAPGGHGCTWIPTKTYKSRKTEMNWNITPNFIYYCVFILFEFFYVLMVEMLKQRQKRPQLSDLWVGAEPNVWFTWICRRREEECVFTQGWCVNRRYSARTLL